MSGIRPKQILTNSSTSLGYIAKLLRMPGSTASVNRVSYSSELLPGLTWGIMDTGTQPIGWRTRGDEVVHILHADNEPDVRVTVDGNTMPMLPGDSLTIGGQSSVGLSHGVLALHAQSDSGGSRPAGLPGHGPEDFDGFNRRTLCATGPHIHLERWKLTVPHTIEVKMRDQAAMVVIFGKISFTHDGSIETLGPGESVVYSDGQVQAVPDGLAYVAIVRKTNWDHTDFAL